MFYDIQLHQSHLTRIINFQTREKCLRENLTPNKNSFEELAKCSETQLNPPHPYPTILGINAGQLLMTTRSYYLSRKEKSPIPPNIIINNRFRNTRNTIVSLWREISHRNEKRRQIYILCIMFLVRPQHWQCYQRGLRGRWSEELMNAFWSMSVCVCVYITGLNVHAPIVTLFRWLRGYIHISYIIIIIVTITVTIIITAVIINIKINSYEYLPCVLCLSLLWFSITFRST